MYKQEYVDKMLFMHQEVIDMYKRIIKENKKAIEFWEGIYNEFL